VQGDYYKYAPEGTTLDSAFTPAEGERHCDWLSKAKDIWTKFGPRRRNPPQPMTTSGNRKAMVILYFK